MCTDTLLCNIQGSSSGNNYSAIWDQKHPYGCMDVQWVLLEGGFCDYHMLFTKYLFDKLRKNDKFSLISFSDIWQNKLSYNWWYNCCSIPIQVAIDTVGTSYQKKRAGWHAPLPQSSVYGFSDRYVTIKVTRRGAAGGFFMEHTVICIGPHGVFPDTIL